MNFRQKLSWFWVYDLVLPLLFCNSPRPLCLWLYRLPSNPDQFSPVSSSCLHFCIQSVFSVSSCVVVCVLFCALYLSSLSVSVFSYQVSVIICFRLNLITCLTQTPAVIAASLSVVLYYYCYALNVKYVISIERVTQSRVISLLEKGWDRCCSKSFRW